MLRGEEGRQFEAWVRPHRKAEGRRFLAPLLLYVVLVAVVPLAMSPSPSRSIVAESVLAFVLAVPGAWAAFDFLPYPRAAAEAGVVAYVAVSIAFCGLQLREEETKEMVGQVSLQLFLLLGTSLARFLLLLRMVASALHPRFPALALIHAAAVAEAGLVLATFVNVCNNQAEATEAEALSGGSGSMQRGSEEACLMAWQFAATAAAAIALSFAASYRHASCVICRWRADSVSPDSGGGCNRGSNGAGCCCGGNADDDRGEDAWAGDAGERNSTDYDGTGPIGGGCHQRVGDGGQRGAADIERGESHRMHGDGEDDSDFGWSLPAKRRHRRTSGRSAGGTMSGGGGFGSGDGGCGDGDAGNACDSDFVAQALHDIGTPLATLLLGHEMLRSDLVALLSNRNGTAAAAASIAAAAAAAAGAPATAALSIDVPPFNREEKGSPHAAGIDHDIAVAAAGLVPVLAVARGRARSLLTPLRVRIVPLSPRLLGKAAVAVAPVDAEAFPSKAGTAAEATAAPMAAKAAPNLSAGAASGTKSTSPSCSRPAETPRAAAVPAAGKADDGDGGDGGGGGSGGSGVVAWQRVQELLDTSLCAIEFICLTRRRVMDCVRHRWAKNLISALNPIPSPENCLLPRLSVSTDVWFNDHSLYSSVSFALDRVS
ncbi:unnamed protein product [Phaeothamnion confervicola]